MTEWENWGTLSLIVYQMKRGRFTMVFSSLVFLLGFLPALLLVYFLII